MPVKIRLMRIGATKRPFYRVVAVDERKKRTGQYLELLGTYNPLTQPKEIILKKDRIEHWTKQGAVLSHGFLRIIGQAPQKPDRKSKDGKETSAPAAETPKPQTAEPAPIEETTVTESTETPTEAPVDAEPTANEETPSEETNQ